ncbi:MAG: hypothetical protein JKY37_17940, partial [Nannocystaceae bacterium]|nr:hypothetical protein [Nannocystaceae bacterium]
ARDDDEIVIEADRTGEAAVGWVVWVQSRHYLETENYDSMLVATNAIFVDRSTMKAAFIAGNTPTDFEVNGCPDHDWPAAAWVTMPVALFVQAVVWAVCWILHQVVIEAMGFMLLNLVAIGCIALVASRPVALLVGWSRFTNVHRAIPLTVVLLGTVIGELAVSVYFIGEQFPGLDLAAAAGLLPSFYAEQSLTYLLMKLLAVVILGTIAKGMSSGHKERTRLWQGYALSSLK